jgi:hypothetical protein
VFYTDWDGRAAAYERIKREREAFGDGAVGDRVRVDDLPPTTPEVEEAREQRRRERERRDRANTTTGRDYQRDEE